MKKKLLLFWRWQFGKFTLIAILAFASMLIIHSCRKDTTPSATITNQEILDAKSWYEGSYSAGSNNVTKLNVTSIKAVQTSSSTDLSQYISPYWANGTTYTRLNTKVAELPTYAASKNIVLSLNSGLTAEQAKNTTNSFIILKDSTGYHAYVMTLIADSTYTKNNPNILGQNKYNKRDTNFSGRVIYSTPNGKLVSSWRYIKGQLVSGSPYIGDGAKSKSLVTDNNTAHSYLASEECYTLYFYTVDPTTGGEIPGSQQNLFSFCDIVINASGGTSSGSTNTSTNSGTSGGANNNPNKPKDPCPPVGSAASVINNNNAMSRVAQNVGQPLGSGFPVPTTTPQSNYPCNVQPPTLQIPPIIKLIHNPNALTADQIQALQHLLDQITSNCIGMALINSLINNGHQFDFSINNSINSQAFYNPTDNTVQMKDPNSIDMYSFQEELFHAFQNFYYKGGTTQYLNKSGSANIEFEAKFLKDLKSTLVGGPLTLQDTNYFNWLLSITNDGKSLPTFLSSSDLSQYFQFMTEFKTLDLGYRYTIINNNLNPSAVFNLINNSNCN